MATNPILTSSANVTAAAQKPAVINDKAAADKAIGSGRSQQNLAILESHQNLSLSAKNEPLSLILKAALEGINEQLKPFLGDNAIETTVANKVDVSPEATADRIVSQSTAFFSAFQKQNNNLSFDQQLEKFIAVIGGGIDQGFKEARGILDGLQVLKGEIADNIDKTYELVQSGLAAFRELQETSSLSANSN
jgi:hypothetical protein